MSLAVAAWCSAMLLLLQYGIVGGHFAREWLDYAFWVFGIPVGVAFYRFTPRRLQDLNCPGKWSRYLIIPFIGIIVLPVLCFMSGERLSNDFGDPPEPSGWLKRGAALVSFVLALLLFRAVMVCYQQVSL